VTKILEIRKKYVNDLEENGTTSYDFATLSPEFAELSLFLINHCLALSKNNFLEAVIIAIFKECTANAVKANLKRAWLSEKKIDINDIKSYQEAMKLFKTEAIEKIDKFVPALENLNLKVQITFSTNENGFELSIANNTGMSAEEISRVRDRISKAHLLDDISEAFDAFADETEGAGLGLLLNIMLLKTSGIGQKNFKFFSDEQNTKVTLTVPQKIQTPLRVTQILDEISNKIDHIPTFPETINQVIMASNDPNSDFNKIAAIIEKDPALASGIITMANSVAYSTGAKVKSVSEATKKLGFKAIRLMAMSFASRNIMEKNFKIFKGFWSHANRCAFYSKKFAEKHGLRSQADTLYLGGLLHDLGKIVLYAVDKETITQINGMIIDKSKANTAKLEEISLGVSHAVVGARLADKWGFSDDLRDMMLHHHTPFAAKEENKKLASIVHVADSLIRIEEGNGRYVHLEVDALTSLGIKDMVELEKFHERIKIEYEN